MQYYLGLDLGGTFVKVGLVDSNRKVVANVQVPTQAEGGPDKVVQVMGDTARQVVNQSGLSLDQVAGIGIGSPGPIDFEAGLVKDAPNLPGWKNVPVRDRIAEATGRPTVLENDANAAAFGEYWAGAGRDPSIRHMVMFTLGTGVGSGLIVDGKLIHGALGFGGEGGHMIIQPDGEQCGCGQRGCMEAYASAAHTARRAREAIESGQPSSLKDLLDHGQPITAKDVFDAARAKRPDALANQIVEQTTKNLAIGCVNICRLLDPQMIVFAGGMILAGDLLFERVRRKFEQLNWKLTSTTVQIVPAQLGNDAGFIGAAAVAWNAVER